MNKKFKRTALIQNRHLVLQYALQYVQKYVICNFFLLLADLVPNKYLYLLNIYVGTMMHFS